MFDVSFFQDISYHKRAESLDLIHHLMGNGQLQAVVQVTENLVCRNALVLHLMNPDRFRPKTGSFTFHQVLGPELTGVALLYEDNLYFPHPRQTAFDLKYGLSFDGDIPTFQASYPADYTIKGERVKTPFNVEEQIFCTNEYAAVLRKVMVTNRRGLDGEKARLFAFLVPNQSLFPDAHYVSDKNVAVAGKYDSGDEFLGFAAMGNNDDHKVAEFPIPFEAAAMGSLSMIDISCDDGSFVRPKGSTMDWLLPPETAYLGAVMSLEFDLGILEPLESRGIHLMYAYGKDENTVLETIDKVRMKGFEELREDIRDYWQGCNVIQTGERRLDDFFHAVKAGVRASVSSTGRMDSALWGYNGEWVHDSSLQCIGATLSGQYDLAKAMIEHLIVDLVDAQGMCFDLTQYDDVNRAVLDQNGWLLYAVWLYWVHARDDSLIRRHWEKIKLVAEFPLRPEFWVEEASMVKSARDWKERDCELFGLVEGFELVFQLWVSLGLDKASDMARLMGDEDYEARWQEVSERVWDSALNHPKYALIENNYFMKRRSLDGNFQTFAETIPYFALPMRIRDTCDIRMFPRRRRGSLEPDPGEAWPIARGMVDPESELARRTLARMETMWNEEWDFGGYPFHRSESEPILLGAWPMTLYVITQAATEARQYDIVRRNIDFMLTTKEGRGYTWWEYRDAYPDQQVDYGFDVNFAYGDPVLLFVHHIIGYRPDVDNLILFPHLLPELEEVSARLRSGKYWLDLHYHNQGRYITKVEVNGEPWLNFTSDKVKLDVPASDIKVEIWLSSES